MAGVASYTIAGRQVGGHYVRFFRPPLSPPCPTTLFNGLQKLTHHNSWPLAGWPPSSEASPTAPLAPRRPLPTRLPRSTPQAPTRPTSSSASILRGTRERPHPLTPKQEVHGGAGQEAVNGDLGDHRRAVCTTQCTYRSMTRRPISRPDPTQFNASHHTFCPQSSMRHRFDQYWHALP